ncbi:Dual specificity protein phosphatase 19 [Habropoda laboriosa]|uniref:Dual specificity protein phosphatase 19 n=1 Tax=Habropoda laboriosa TaxID=597456 RepID=A0A0L7R7H2_9HYME|nr:PREDICTED: dual specificity protein phosphatase 19 [Habropoda laboriosa]KOC66820.1 Dual specificity protein phosphatase 19 [Habropoda laboriosa]
MDLNSLIKSKKLHLKACKTIVTNMLGQKYEEINGEKKELPPGIPFVIDSKPDLEIACVMPGLFLSSQDPVVCKELLEKYEIRHILSIGIVAPVKFNDMKYYHCDLLDVPESNLLIAVNECIKIIHENRNENILVHCNAGVSRSPAIVISYLMALENIFYDDAYNKVKMIRNCIKPNEGFVKQLKTLQLPFVL